MIIDTELLDKVSKQAKTSPGQWGQVSVSRCLRVHVKLLRAA